MKGKRSGVGDRPTVVAVGLVAAARAAARRETATTREEQTHRIE